MSQFYVSVINAFGGSAVTIEELAEALGVNELKKKVALLEQELAVRKAKEEIKDCITCQHSSRSSAKEPCSSCKNYNLWESK